MRAGRLREIANIQSFTESISGSGQVTRGWTALFSNVFCLVEPVRGKENYQHDKTNAEMTHRIKMRWHNGVTPKMRVIWNSRTFNIVEIKEDYKHADELHLLCIEDKD